ncbi:MAG TPA: DUF448 domain-containing protein [Campylobacterales bacterium]|nr:DUF448 domain-containing protein [Campylobacterales bacterium]
MNKHNPVRMCIVCRNRFLQGELKRLQYIDGNIKEFTKSGRSFYLCTECLGSKQLTKRLSSFLKIPKTDAETICARLKESDF